MPPLKDPGALLDTRPASAKQKDYFLVETVSAAAPVQWREKAPSEWRKFPLQDQNGSGSCVAQTGRKLAGIVISQRNGKYIDFSASHIYQRRSNKPAAGMVGVEAFDIMSAGITLEALAPSEKMTDAEMDSVKVEKYEEDVAKVFSMGNHVGLTPGDIDTVASVIQQTGKGVMAWFYFTYAEWSDVPAVLNQNLTLNSTGVLRHSVAVVDFTLYQGQKALIIEDSWGEFGQFKGQRVITESFFKKRNWFVRYTMQFKFDASQPPSDKPVYAFTKPLVFIPLDADTGEISLPIASRLQEKDVIALQTILKYEGFYPANIEATGYYGAITAKAVYQWQVAHSVAPLSELDSIVPKGGRFGQKSINVANDIYA